MNFVHFIQLILVMAILIAVGVPLFRGLSKIKLFAKLDKSGEEYKHLLVRKEEVLLSIKDLQFDLKTNKVSEQDYQKQRKKLELETIAILEKLENLEELEKAKKKGKKSSNPAKVV
ncbi:MAG: hypothetical protein IID17_03810 [Nitrospinae bacterium]|nr:hypothetical protein [Nitrospinota bacterium]